MILTVYVHLDDNGTDRERAIEARSLLEAAGRGIAGGSWIVSITRERSALDTKITEDES